MNFQENSMSRDKSIKEELMNSRNANIKNLRGQGLTTDYLNQ